MTFDFAAFFTKVATFFPDLFSGFWGAASTFVGRVIGALLGGGA